MAEGWAAPGIEVASSRALELSEKLGGDPRAVPALGQLAWYFNSTGDFPQGHRIATRMLEVAKGLEDNLQEAMAHWTLGLTLAYRGEFAQGLEHLEKTEAFYTPEHHGQLSYYFGLDPGVAAKVHSGWNSELPRLP